MVSSNLTRGDLRRGDRASAEVTCGRDRRGDRDGVPALPARRLLHRPRTSSSAPRSSTASATRPGRRSGRSPTPTAWASTGRPRRGPRRRSQQRVEILKVLYRGARIIILDEPTAVLVPQEVEELFDNLRELKAEGLTVIFISHKLDEVLSVADAITVIRRGTTVAEVLPRTSPLATSPSSWSAPSCRHRAPRSRPSPRTPARHRGHLPRQPTRRAPAAERHRPDDSCGRDRRDRRRRGQRPG